MSEPVWVHDDIALLVHERQLAEHGGGSGVRDIGLLSSALERPKNIFQYSDGKADLPELAAAYAFGIARNHPFVDGNKRTAFVACLLFLALNGFSVKASQTEKYDMFLRLASGDVSEQALADWLRMKLTPRH